MKFMTFLLLILTVSAYSALEVDSEQESPMRFIIDRNAENHRKIYENECGKKRKVEFIRHNLDRGEFVMQTLGRDGKFSVEMGFDKDVNKTVTARVTFCGAEAVVTVDAPSHGVVFAKDMSSECLGNVNIATVEKAPISWRPEVSPHQARPSSFGVVDADKDSANIVWYIYRSPNDLEGVFVGVHVDYENPYNAYLYWGTEKYGGSVLADLRWEGQRLGGETPKSAVVKPNIVDSQAAF